LHRLVCQVCSVEFESRLKNGKYCGLNASGRLSNQSRRARGLLSRGRIASLHLKVKLSQFAELRLRRAPAAGALPHENARAAQAGLRRLCKALYPDRPLATAPLVPDDILPVDHTANEHPPGGVRVLGADRLSVDWPAGLLLPRVRRQECGEQARRAEAQQHATGLGSGFP